jgi:hypothetical protein
MHARIQALRGARVLLTGGWWAGGRADEYFVVVLSDANLGQYGITPEALARALTADPRVRASLLFIGSLRDEAARYVVLCLTVMLWTSTEHDHHGWWATGTG